MPLIVATENSTLCYSVIDMFSNVWGHMCSLHEVYFQVAWGMIYFILGVAGFSIFYLIFDSLLFKSEI